MPLILIIKNITKGQNNMLINQQTDNKTITHKTGFLSGILKLMKTGKKTVPVVSTQPADPEDLELLECLKKAKSDWIDAYRDFNYVDDQDLVDFHTYRIKAYQLRYEYFLKKAKEKGLKFIGIDDESIIGSMKEK